jgi:hypothetical protein
MKNKTWLKQQTFDFFSDAAIFLAETQNRQNLSFSFTLLSPRFYELVQRQPYYTIQQNSVTLGGKIMNKIAYKEQVMKRLSYIQILAKEERYEEIQNLLETNFVLVA